MPRVGLLFELRCAETLPGESVLVTGDRLELGGWDLSRTADAGLWLRTGVLLYPSWTMASPVWLDLPAEYENPGVLRGPDGLDLHCTPRGDNLLSIEYKFARNQKMIADKREFEWEHGTSNRRVIVPREHGSIWLVSHAAWNSDEPPQVTRASFAEVLTRQGELDPSWVMARISPPVPRSNKMLSSDIEVPFKIKGHDSAQDFLLTPEHSDAEARSPETWAIEEEFAALAAANIKGVSSARSPGSWSIEEEFGALSSVDITGLTLTPSPTTRTSARSPGSWSIEEEFSGLATANITGLASTPSPTTRTSESGGEWTEPEPEEYGLLHIKYPAAKVSDKDAASLRRENIALRKLVHTLLLETWYGEESNPYPSLPAEQQRRQVETSELMRILEQRRKVIEGPEETVAGG